MDKRIRCLIILTNLSRARRETRKRNVLLIEVGRRPKREPSENLTFETDDDDYLNDDGRRVLFSPSLKNELQREEAQKILVTDWISVVDLPTFYFF